MARRLPDTPQVWEAFKVQRIAGILGPSSAAHAAHAEWHRRMDAGEDVSIIRCGDVWLVGVDPTQPPPVDTLMKIANDPLPCPSGG